MPDPHAFLLFLAALAAAYLAPGPDMALLLSTAAGRGVRAGLRTALGLACARALHALAAGLGLAALFAAHPPLQTAVRIGGALYLLHLAAQTFRPAAARQKTPGDRARKEKTRPDFLRGFLTNLLNPKALLFCGLFLPQFVSPARGALLPQFLLLGATLALAGLAFDAAYSLLAGGLPRLFRGAAETRFARARRWFMGSVFAALAARLVAG